jgi:hypothetical protein
MEYPGRADINLACGISFTLQDFSQLPGAIFIRPVRDADEEMITSLANIPAIQGARWLDGMYYRVMLSQALPDTGHLTLPADSTWMRQDSTTGGKHRRVLDKG